MDGYPPSLFRWSLNAFQSGIAFLDAFSGNKRLSDKEAAGGGSKSDITRSGIRLLSIFNLSYILENDSSYLLKMFY